MNFFKLTGILFLHLFLSCKGADKSSFANKPGKFQFGDTFFVDCKECVVSIKLTEERIETIKSNYKSEEDFYTMADDANSYSSKAFNFFVSKNLDTITVDNFKILNFANKFFLNVKDISPWDPILYKKNSEPKIIKSIDAKIEFEKYFTLNNISRDSGTIYIPKGFYKLDSCIINLNNDAFPDKILVLENEAVRNIENHNHFNLKFILLKGKAGKGFEPWGENDNISEDKNNNCPADGYRRIVTKDKYFTIEQVNCSGPGLVQQFITFKYDAAQSKVILHKYGEEYIVSDNAHENKPAKTFSEKEFGNIEFKDFSDEIIIKLRNKRM